MWQGSYHPCSIRGGPALYQTPPLYEIHRNGWNVQEIWALIQISLLAAEPFPWPLASVSPSEKEAGQIEGPLGNLGLLG